MAFEDAAFGLGSVEEFLTLAYTFLIKQGIIDFSKLIKLCAYNPALILKELKKAAWKRAQWLILSCLIPQSPKRLMINIHFILVIHCMERLNKLSLMEHWSFINNKFYSDKVRMQEQAKRSVLRSYRVVL